MMTTPTVQELQSQLATAEEQARQASVELDRRQAEAAERRTAAQRTHAEQHYAAHHDEDERLQAEYRAAHEEFRAAVLNSDIGKAWLRARAARWQRMALATTTNNAASVIGARPVGEVAFSQPRLFEDVVAILDDAAKMSYDFALDVYEDARSKAGDAAAGAVGLGNPVDELQHAAGCPEERTEVVDVPVGWRSTGSVVRCVSCAATRVLSVPPPEPEEALARGPAEDRRTVEWAAILPETAA
jgi:hypothetical protein